MHTWQSDRMHRSWKPKILHGIPGFESQRVRHRLQAHFFFPKGLSSGRFFISFSFHLIYQLFICRCNTSLRVKPLVSGTIRRVLPIEFQHTPQGNLSAIITFPNASYGTERLHIVPANVAVTIPNGFVTRNHKGLHFEWSKCESALALECQTPMLLRDNFWTE